MYYLFISLIIKYLFPEKSRVTQCTIEGLCLSLLFLAIIICYRQNVENRAISLVQGLLKVKTIIPFDYT